MLATTHTTVYSLAQQHVVLGQVASFFTGAPVKCSLSGLARDQNLRFNMIPWGQALKLETLSASQHLHQIPIFPVLGAWTAR